jgi:Leucine-rich repeat (LRR) protein
MTRFRSSHDATFADDAQEHWLRRLCGREDLSTVESLELRDIDSSVVALESLGTSLPSLAQLRLSVGCTLASFRHLGTSLGAHGDGGYERPHLNVPTTTVHKRIVFSGRLRVLRAPRCGICELDGVGALAGLQELYLAFNDLQDCAALALHDTLEVLDLEGNRYVLTSAAGGAPPLWQTSTSLGVPPPHLTSHHITPHRLPHRIASVSGLDALQTCPRLSSLTLATNPIATQARYRSRVGGACHGSVHALQLGTRCGDQR